MNVPGDRALLASLVCTGTAALGYEIIWTRLATPLLGSETLAVLATLAGFFGGMALGSAVLARRAVAGSNPIALFVGLEVFAAAFAMASPYLLHALGPVVPAWVGSAAGDNDTPQALAIAIAVAGALMLPGTFCMGATLAAVTEARRRASPTDDHGRGAARIYAANTFGAVVGVTATIYLLLPALGLARGALTLGAIGLLGAGLAHRWGARTPAVRVPVAEPARRQALDTSRDPDPDVDKEALPLLVLMGGTGLVGVGLEVMGVLVLSQVFENTIYTFANVLLVYLLGTAAGSAIFARWGAAWTAGRPATAAAALLIFLAVANIVAVTMCAQAPTVLDALAPPGSSLSRHLASELVIAAVVFAPATVLMGALFAHGMGLLTARGIGGAYALNTLGSAAAPFVFGAWAASRLGYKDGFYLVSYGYLAVFAAFTWFRRFRPLHQLGAMLGVVALTALGPKDLILVKADEGWEVLAEHQSPMGLVIVSERANASDAAGALPLRRLQIGRHFRMGGAMAFGERRMGHIPLLLHADPRRALFLGVGTGATLGAVTSFPDLAHIDAVELVPAVLDELARFSDINGNAAEDPRIEFHGADARRFVAASQGTYDVIVADLFHPGHDGAGGLYAREHFAQIAEHLSPGGLFGQWLPLYQLDKASLQTIVCSFVDVFPQAHAILGIYNVQTPAIALVGTRGEPLTIDVARLSKALDAPIYRQLLMQDPRDLLSAMLLGPKDLAGVCDDGPRNTDLTPWVTLWAPRVAYEGSGTHGADNLMSLMAQARGVPATAVIRNAPPEFVDQVADFAKALRAYLEGEVLRVRSPADAGAAPPASVDAYLAAYRAAPQFTPARGMLYTLAQKQPTLTESILSSMLQIEPGEPRTWQLWLEYLRRMGDGPRLQAAQAEAQRRFGAASSGSGGP